MRGFSNDYPFLVSIPTSEPYRSAGLTYDQKVPMIQLCVYPDDCPVRTQIRSSMSGFSSVDDDAFPLTADVSVALNGQDFVTSSTPYYIFDDNMVYYEPLISGPVLGPDSGGTDLTFYVPILPLIDIAGYFAFMEDPTTADSPIDSVVIRFSAISSEFVEYEPAQMKSVDLSKDNYLFVTTPPLQADKAYDVSLSINGQDFCSARVRDGRDERGRGVKEHAETHCSVSWRCWSLSYVTATAAALQQAAPPLALDP